jgi:hypothetical protein
LGVSRYELDVGKIFGAVPYGLLKKHLGNEMIFYASAAFNTINLHQINTSAFVIDISLRVLS